MLHYSFHFRRLASSQHLAAQAPPLGSRALRGQVEVVRLAGARRRQHPRPRRPARAPRRVHQEVAGEQGTPAAGVQYQHGRAPARRAHFLCERHGQHLHTGGVRAAAARRRAGDGRLRERRAQLRRRMEHRLHPECEKIRNRC